jgi:hypothetical protein
VNHAETAVKQIRLAVRHTRLAAMQSRTAVISSRNAVTYSEMEESLAVGGAPGFLYTASP